MGLMVLGPFSQSRGWEVLKSPRKKKQFEKLEGGIKDRGRDDESSS